QAFEPKTPRQEVSTRVESGLSPKEGDFSQSRVQISYGELCRSFSLPQDIDQARAQAKYADSVRELVLPKASADPACRKRLEVYRGRVTEIGSSLCGLLPCRTVGRSHGPERRGHFLYGRTASRRRIPSPVLPRRPIPC